MLESERRAVSHRAADASALRAIAQACVNVELFTIPLYMGTLTSIQGMHQVTGKENDFYENRLWPGAATTANPDNANERAFNLIFSVFIEEMLHLQLAANIASAIGVAPCFTSPALQDKAHGWTCYGPDKTVIPHIIDLVDTPHDVTVNIAALSPQQVELFLAIEEPSGIAREHIAESARSKYFPAVPFGGWTANKTEVDLPMFGTIDWMYQCYFEYMSLVYTDGKTLWEHVFTAGSQQNDMFNVKDSPGHPKVEYPGFRATLTATDATQAFTQAVVMINAITDQGEGSTLDQRLDPEDLPDVEARYQPADDALVADYPYYSDSGALEASADAVARYDNGAADHYERFTELGELVSQVETWPAWHQRHGPWTVIDLQTAPAPNGYGIPSPGAVADAMNRVGAARDAMYPQISQAAVGSIAGITTVLNTYWAQPGVGFPYPSMTGSMDRMAICWALFGQAPDLSTGVGDPDPGTLYHACQCLDLSKPGHNCAVMEVYHCCRASNKCRSQGGCGFVQKISEGGTPGASCGFALVKAKVTGDANGGKYSVPSGNLCASFGGCAVPISASQLLAQSGTMELFDDDDEPFATMPFTEGELAHVVAYRAYLTLMDHRESSVKPPAHSPVPNDLRLVLTPST